MSLTAENEKLQTLIVTLKKPKKNTTADRNELLRSPSENRPRTAVVLHICPHVPFFQAVSKRAVPNIVALLLLHYVYTHLQKTQ